MDPSDFIADMFQPDEIIALVLVPRIEDAKTQQRIWPAGKACSEKIMKWLKWSNANGYDIYIGMNPLQPGSRSRNKSDILKVCRVYLDLDEDGPPKLKEILQDCFSNKLPSASYLINTSPDRYQLIWNIVPASLTPGEAEKLMRGLATRYGGDRAVTDVARVLRLPGFMHRGKNTWITMSSTATRHADKSDWPASLFNEPPQTLTDPKTSSPHRSGGDSSPSGLDWAWTKDRMRTGEVSDQQLEKELAAARQDKRNPEDYAKRTVARARQSIEMER